jgi:hypothetical protein
MWWLGVGISDCFFRSGQKMELMTTIQNQLRRKTRQVTADEHGLSSSFSQGISQRQTPHHVSGSDLY